MSALQQLAAENLRRLSDNPYPGRGIVLGTNADGDKLIQVYWIMGRSPNSRNRIFEVQEETSLWTAPADEEKVEDPSLIIYRAMAEDRESGLYVVSNGHQTDAFFLVRGEAIPYSGFDQALARWKYEPDHPNYTPRITGLTLIGECMDVLWEAGQRLILSRRSIFDDTCDEFRFDYSHQEGANGFGHCLTTYAGDAAPGEPLPPFQGEPYIVPLNGASEEIADQFWAALNPDNRISLAVKTIDPLEGTSAITVRNAYEKVVQLD